MTDVVLVGNERIVTVRDSSTSVVETGIPNTVVVEITTGTVEVLSRSLVVEVASQGVPGLPGPQGPPGDATTAVAVENITAFKAVALDANGGAYLADSTVIGDATRFAGISTISALTGETVTLETDGLLEGIPGLTPGPVFVGPDGSLSSTPTGAYQLQIGVAMSTSVLLVRPQFPIYL